jgi:hypothetical protein
MTSITLSVTVPTLGFIHPHFLEQDCVKNRMASKEISKFHLDNFKTLAKHTLKFTSFSVKQIVNSIILINYC